MWAAGRGLLRGFRAAWGARGLEQQQQHSRLRPDLAARRSIVTAAAGGAGAAGSLLQLLGRTGWSARLGVAGGVAASTAAWKWREGDEELGPFETAQLAWVQDLAAQEGMREMLVPGQMLRKHPVGQLLTEDDHLFETMRRSEQVKEFRCFYNAKERKFYSVVMLGKDVCGYPSTVHGGLTAAIVDETFGGLYTALLTSGNLGATLPGLTARLELDYKKKVPAGTVLLVTAELEAVEPRKVWMHASVTDGGRNTFATGRALFVAPNLAKLFGLQKWRDAGKQVAVAAPGPAAAVA